MALSEKIIVRNPAGLHLRAATRLIQVTRQYKCRITLRKGAETVNGRSILGLLNLAAACGTELEVVSDGEDAREALEEVRKFFLKTENWS